MADAHERYGTVEARVAALEQRVMDLDVRVGAMTPMIATVATLSERVDTIRIEFAEFRKLINARDEEARRDRQTFTRWAITLTVTIICALIGAMAVIISAGAHP